VLNLSRKTIVATPLFVLALTEFPKLYPYIYALLKRM
jgi:hypothetical protein